MSESRSNYESCLSDCGRSIPGLGIERPELVDYSKQNTTVDQTRIETELERLELFGASLLHVGVGNSQLAKRFSPYVGHITGITVSDAEKQHADSLGLPNYEVHLLNKYSANLGTLPHRYHFILDNNLAGFACCQKHFGWMMKNYVKLLATQGQIFTDQRGMDWVVGDPRWKLTFEDLVRLEQKYPLKAVRRTNFVYALRRVS